MSIYDKQRTTLRVSAFDADTGRVTLVEHSGYAYRVSLAQMGECFTEADPPRPGEFVEAVIVGPDRVTDIFPCERTEMDSVGPIPDVVVPVFGVARNLDHLNPDIKK
jgi:hypothetical protein